MNGSWEVDSYREGEWTVGVRKNLKAVKLSQ
jgi:hypothetical protein